jgi:thiol:disulfide interchange protein DsbD
MKKLYTLLLVLLVLQSQAQIENPVKWSYSAQKTGKNETNVQIKASIQKGWHLYSQFIEDGGPIPTSFTFSPSKDFQLEGKVSESPKAVTAFDPNFGMKIAWHETQVTFIQKIKTTSDNFTLKGVLEYMVCNNSKCLPPTEQEFSIPVDVSEVATVAAILPIDTSTVGAVNTTLKVEESKTIANPENGASLWSIFIAGFLGGLAAFFMPCIYPMIPLTVSFFTKKSGSRAKGIRSAALYGFFIVAIYVSLGLIITLLFGTSALNEAASSATFNLLFFGLLIVFALSFLGAFEITLPAALVNKWMQNRIEVA